MIRRASILTAAFTLAACVTPQDAETSAHGRLARAYLDSARAGRVDYLASQLAPSLRVLNGVADSLGSALRDLPASPWHSSRLIGWRINTFNGERSSALTYEILGSNGWGLAHVAIAEDSGSPVITAFRTQRLKRSLEEEHAFHFSGKPLSNYGALFLAIVSLAISFGAAVWAIRERLPKRWLWAFVALLGGSDLLVNWTTGEVGSKLISIRFPTVGLQRPSDAAPWILMVAFPIGAFLVAERIRRHRKAVASIVPEPLANEELKPTATASSLVE